MTGGPDDPRLHPQIAALLREQGDAPDFSDLGLEAARARMRGLQQRSGAPVPVRSVEELAVPGPAGDLATSVYTPLTPEGTGPLPGLLYLHGGGWIGGDRHSIDGTCRKLAAWSGCLVVAPDYRLAPEHPFPAAVDDVVAVARWLQGHAEEIGGRRDWIAAGGASSGANLAIALALTAAAHSDLDLAFLLLAYPPVDQRLDQPSCSTYGEGYILTTRSMRWFWSLYCPDAALAADPVASPLQAPDLAGLPPTHLLAAELDPLHDQVEAFGRRLADSGVPVSYVTARGMTHGFLGMSELIDDADHHLRAQAQALATAAGMPAPG